MRTLIFMLFLTLLMDDLNAKAPECPLYPNLQTCLTSVEDTYRNYLEFINGEYEEQDAGPLLQAATDVKHFESLACEKTCVN